MLILCFLKLFVVNSEEQLMKEDIKEKVRQKAYKSWKNMNYRCYNKNHQRYVSYGSRGVYVSERWLEFDNYLEDLPQVEGWDLNLYLEGKIFLDKDYKCRENKEYSLDKCKFITISENNKYKPSQQRLTVGISPEGLRYEFYNQSEFARKHNLRQGSISECLNGKLKTHKKWKFYIK